MILEIYSSPFITIFTIIVQSLFIVSSSSSSDASSLRGNNYYNHHHQQQQQRTLNYFNRTTTTSTPLRCAVILLDTEYPLGVEDDDDYEYMCQPVYNRIQSAISYRLILPDTFLRENKQRLQDYTRDILIDGGYIEDSRIMGITENNVRLIRTARGTTNNDNAIIPNTSNNGYVERKVLVIRVTTSTSSPIYTAEQMYDNFFSEYKLTLRSQYSACSHGKLTFVPVTSTDIHPNVTTIDGILDIELMNDYNNNTNSSSSYDRLALTNEVITKAQDVLGISNINQIANNIIICHPPKASYDSEDWLAFAYLNQPLSVYNGEWCGYISAHMHEVGHNLGFKHSNNLGRYGDRTGYMGYSYGVANWPSMCFNAVKNWQTGWFIDRSIDLLEDEKFSILTNNHREGRGVVGRSSSSSWTGKIATFVDYHLAKEDEYVIVKVGNLFLQYNRAKAMNAQTFDKANQLVIVTTSNEENESEIVKGLDGRYFSTTYYQQSTNFTKTVKGETLFVAICSHHLGDNRTQADYYRVSIGLNTLDCSEEEEEEEVIAEDDEEEGVSNTMIAVEDDTTTISPSTISSFPPSEVPSISSSSQPSNSPSTSSYPTNNPSWQPPDRGGRCDDDLSVVFDAVQYGTDTNFTCHTLQNNESLRNRLCRVEDSSSVIYNTCAETCGKCTDTCIDDDDDRFFLYENAWRNCNWVRDQSYKDLSSKLCLLGTTPHNYCRETCNSCDSIQDGENSCYDSIENDAFYISFGITGMYHNCSWLASPTNWFWRFALCNERYDTYHACPLTCSKCYTRGRCEDQLSETFVYNGVNRDCTWLANAPIWQIRDACTNNDDDENTVISELCAKTCGNCK